MGVWPLSPSPGAPRSVGSFPSPVPRASARVALRSHVFCGGPGSQHLGLRAPSVCLSATASQLCGRAGRQAAGRDKVSECGRVPGNSAHSRGPAWGCRQPWFGACARTNCCARSPPKGWKSAHVCPSQGQGREHVHCPRKWPVPALSMAPPRAAATRALSVTTHSAFPRTV